MTWQVITGDCLEVMPTLPAGSIDAILTDLPYGTTACSWDSVIPFEPMWAAIKHVLKPRGVFVTTASQPFTSALVMSNPKWFKYEWVWNKKHAVGFQIAKYRPMMQHENVTVFSPSSPKYNPIMTPRPKTKSRGSYSARPESASPLKYDDGKDRSYNEWYPKSIIEIGNAHQAAKVHPTQKPVALYEYLIRTYTNEGETVLDMTAGSGTTGVAAINTGRNVILIEKREDYADIARRRCTEAMEQARQLAMPLGAGVED